MELHMCKTATDDREGEDCDDEHACTIHTWSYACDMCYDDVHVHVHVMMHSGLQ